MSNYLDDYPEERFRIYTKGFGGCWAAKCSGSNIYDYQKTFWAFAFSRTRAVEKLNRRLRRIFGNKKSDSWTQY